MATGDPALLTERAALVDALKAAVVVNGYRTNVGDNVDIFDLPADMIPDGRLPHAGVTLVKESPGTDGEEVASELCPWVTAQWNVTVTVQDEDVDAALIRVMEDVKEAVEADPTLGGAVANIRWADTGLSPFRLQNNTRGQGVLLFISERPA